MRLNRTASIRSRLAGRGDVLAAPGASLFAAGALLAMIASSSAWAYEQEEAHEHETGTEEAAPAAATEPLETGDASGAWPGFGFDRVDLISEAPGTFLNWDVPTQSRAYPLGLVMRGVEQLSVAFRLPVEGLYASASIQAQTLTYEYPLLPGSGLYVTGGLQTKLAFPMGVLGGVAWRSGIFRVGASVSAFTNGSWSNPGSGHITVLPTFGFGVGAPVNHP